MKEHKLNIVRYAYIYIYVYTYIYRVNKPTNFLTITLITPRMLYLFYRLYIFTSYVSLHPSSPLQLLYTSKSTSYIYIYIYIYISTSQIFNHHTNHNSYYKLTRQIVYIYKSMLSYLRHIPHNFLILPHLPQYICIKHYR